MANPPPAADRLMQPADRVARLEPLQEADALLAVEPADAVLQVEPLLAAEQVEPLLGIPEVAAAAPATLLERIAGLANVPAMAEVVELALSPTLDPVIPSELRPEVIRDVSELAASDPELLRLLRQLSAAPLR